MTPGGRQRSGEQVDNGKLWMAPVPAAAES